MFGIDIGELVKIVKKVLSEILKWIWDKIKDWIIANWSIAAVAILSLIVLFLVRILLTGLSFSAFQRFLSPNTPG